MKLTLLVLISSAFLCSCTYQYFTLSGEQLTRNENNDFVVENDTLKITYRFSGYSGPVRITLYNKTNEPLEIDWRKSALIMDGKAYGYYSPNLLLDGSVEVDTLKRYYNRTRNVNPVYLSDLKADIYVNEASQFIPPRSSISKIPLSLPVHSIELPSERFQKLKYTTAKEYSVKYKKMEYTSEKSPVSFRSYLSFNYNGDSQKTFSEEHHFYISEIWESGSGPNYFPQEIVEKGDVFYVSE